MPPTTHNIRTKIYAALLLVAFTAAAYIAISYLISTPNINTGSSSVSKQETKLVTTEERYAELQTATALHQDPKVINQRRGELK